MRKYTYKDSSSILYLVATPIGNLEDITFRAVRILNEVDKIYAEDTRNSRVLLQHYDINTPLSSYHDFASKEREDQIIEELKNGMSVAIISDAGLPVISDPGFELVSKAIKNDIPVTTIPGPSAATSALIASGLAPLPYMFCGFLDSKQSKRLSALEKLKYESQTLIFYEAPHRIKQTLADMLSVFGSREVVLARELTKQFEEFIRGSIEEVLAYEDNIKGEMVLLVSGYQEEEKSIDDIDINEEVNKMINTLGYKAKEAIKEVSLMYNLDKHEVYKDYCAFKQKKHTN